ncbi:hypothetical protein LZ023_36450 (plasmid) [Pseudomonas silvicola]|nr:hypothetical protein LZ023_36450 [Pseudomonas silvicola]
MDALTLRLALIQRHCAADAVELEHLLTDCEARAAGVSAFAAQHFANAAAGKRLGFRFTAAAGVPHE